MEPPAPPPVTITNPNAPLLSGDVLEGGRDPWRPSRRQKQIAWVVVGVLAVVAGSYAVADRIRDGRRLDLEALSAISFAVDVDPTSSEYREDAVALQLRNDGPHTVRLRSVMLGTSGGARVEVAESVVQFGVVTVIVSDGAPCHTARLLAPVSSLRADLSTHRGQRVTRELRLSPSAVDAVRDSYKNRCGYRQPAEAFGVSTEEVRRQRRAVVVRARLRNDSVLPLELRRLIPLPGLRVTVTPPLPLAIPQQAQPQRLDKELQVTLRFEVTSCTTFLESSMNDPSLLQGWLVRDATVTERPVWVAGTLDADLAVVADPLSELRALCPPQVAYF